MTPTVSPGRGRPRSSPRRTQAAGSTSAPAAKETLSGSRCTTWRGTQHELAVPARPREADLVVVQAELRVALLAPPAPVARDHPLAHHPFPDLEIGHALAELGDGAAPLVARHEREVHPARVRQATVEHLEIGAAHPGDVAPDEHLARTGARCLELDQRDLVRPLDERRPSRLDHSAVDARGAPDRARETSASAPRRRPASPRRVRRPPRVRTVAFDRLVHVREHAAGDAAEQRRAERRALLDDRALDREPEDRKRRSRARAASGRRRPRRDALVASTPSSRRRSSESRSPKATPFEHGAHERAPIVAQRESGECAARVGVGVRRSLALEVREEEESLGPRLPALGLGQQARRTGRPGRSCRGTTGASPPPMSMTPIASHGPGTAWQNACTRAAGRVRTRGARRRRRRRCRGRPRPVRARRSAPRARDCWSPAPAATGMPPASAGDSGGLERRAGATRAGISSASSDLVAPAPARRRRRATCPTRPRRRSPTRRSGAGGRSPWAGRCARCARRRPARGGGARGASGP